MAQHDYSIANQSGSAFRADLNNALLAIVSNNSGSSEPTTTYAYQWWADTTTGQLKLRNAANSAWIVVQELDGTMLMEDGTAAAPGLAFASDLNTGFYRIGADQLGIATNGTAAVAIDASQRVGIGITSPSTLLHVAQSSAGSTVIGRIENTNTGADSDAALDLKTPNAAYSLKAKRTGARFDFEVDGSQKLSIDSSGRLLVGTTSARSNYFNTASTYAPQLQLEGVSSSGQTMMSLTSSDASLPSYLILARQKSGTIGGNSIVANNDALGYIAFQGSDGSEFVAGAYIHAEVDGTPGADDMPGRLVFSTTKNGANDPVERLSISNAGLLAMVADAGDAFYLGANAGAGTANYLMSLRHTATAGTMYSGTECLKIFTNGNVVNTNNSYGPLSSDERLKQDIVDVGSQWDDIKAVRLTKFRFKNDPTGELQLGPIAQELEQVSPGLITRRPASEDEIADPSNGLVDGDEVLSFKASILYMKAVGALQEAMQRIEDLEAKVAALESA